jgi:uncharacterized protein YuzE
MNSLAIGDWIFDSVEYDADRDVLYLSIGEPQAGHGDETPEGHILRFNEDEAFCGVTLIDVRKILEEDGQVVVAVPPRPQLDEPQRRRLLPSDLNHALTTC